MSDLLPSDRAPGLLVAPGVEIPGDAELGAYAIVHAGVRLGAGVSVGHGAILGRPPRFHGRSRAAPAPTTWTEIGDGVVVGDRASVLAGTRVGPGAFLGDESRIREGVVVGAGSVLGASASLGVLCLVGERVRIYNGTRVSPGTVFEDDVLVGGDVLIVSDKTMGRTQNGPATSGVVLRRACRIGSRAVIEPGVEVGEEAVVGAMSLVREDVPPRTLVVGQPARARRVVPEEELLR